MIGKYFLKIAYTGGTSLLFAITSAEVHDGLFEGGLSKMDLKILSVVFFTTVISIVMEHQSVTKKSTKFVIIFLTPVISFSFVWLTYEYTLEHGYGTGLSLFIAFIMGLKAFAVIRILFDRESNERMKKTVYLIWDRGASVVERIFGK